MHDWDTTSVHITAAIIAKLWTVYINLIGGILFDGTVRIGRLRGKKNDV